VPGGLQDFLKSYLSISSFKVFTQKKIIFLQSSKSDGGNKTQFEYLNYNAKSKGNKTERAELLVCWANNKQ